MAVALKAYREQTITEAAEPDDDPPPALPFVYGYDEDGYLVSDGQPMAENPPHRRETNNSIESLAAHFLDRPDVYASGCDYIHYLPNENKPVSPDCYVVFGVAKRKPNGKLRMNFRVWEKGGRVPAIVFEFTSKQTKKKDQNARFKLYEQVLKVPEYIIFDPQSEYLTPNLQGYRLNAAGHYEPISVENGRMYSASLDLYLEANGAYLRFFDAKTGEYLRSPAEAEAQRKIAERERGIAEHQRREAEIRAEREARERREAKNRAERETQARQQETRRADDEARRRETEEQLAALRAELEALRRQQDQA